MHSRPEIAAPDPAPCTACGACCAHTRDWPRFTLETDDEIGLIPPEYVAASGSGMRCVGDRCAALIGTVGEATACGIYPVRPQVCRWCEPGDLACAEARGARGMAPLPPL